MECFIQVESESLLKIFQYYCSYGDPMNTSKMKNSKFVKIFQDAQLVVDTKQVSMMTKTSAKMNL